MNRWLRNLFPFAPWQIMEVRYWFFAALGLTIVALGCAAIGLWPLRHADALVLHYTPVFGIDWIGPWWYAFLPSTLAVTALVINSLLMSALATRHRGFLQTVGACTAALEIGCVIAAVIIINLNR